VLSILAYLGWEAFPIARMNGDPASERVRADMAQWGVRLDFASCGPTAHTPIIIQEIRRGRDGKPKHRFSWSCPKCGQWLPAFKPVTRAAVDAVAPALKDASVFFLDRLSRATLTLAKDAAMHGAVVVLEPSGKATDKLMGEALGIAHVVKYADQRLTGVDGVMGRGTATLVEVQTLGEKGLRYRHRFGHAPSDWVHLGAVHAPRLSDSCGSGDWCTAGLVAKVAAGGQAGLRDGGAQGVRAALRYGQALAAWNCGFEGARGGMYAVTRKVFEAQIAALLVGQIDCVTDTVLEPTSESLIDCPSCSLVPRDRPTTPRRKRAAA
jgi:sugar/nucleoside kinase (ribokinase family)